MKTKGLRLELGIRIAGRGGESVKVSKAGSINGKTNVADMLLNIFNVRWRDFSLKTWNTFKCKNIDDLSAHSF